MSLTQWLTRSSPTVSWTPLSKATFSLVPTPSALATSTGVRRAERRQAEQAAEAADLRQHARRERALGQRPDAPHDFVAGVDVDAARLVVHLVSWPPGRRSEVQRRHHPLDAGARRRALRRLPVEGAGSARRSAPRRGPRRACRSRRAAAAAPPSDRTRARARRATPAGSPTAAPASASAIGARTGSTDGSPMVISVSQARGAAAARQHAERRRPTSAPAPGGPGSSW